MVDFTGKGNLPDVGYCFATMSSINDLMVEIKVDKIKVDKQPELVALAMNLVEDLSLHSDIALVMDRE